MNKSMNEQKEGWIGEWKEGWINEWKEVWINEWMNEQLSYLGISSFSLAGDLSLESNIPY